MPQALIVETALASFLSPEGPERLEAALARRLRNWLASRPDIPIPRDVRLYDHHFMMLEAVASGLGVALSPRIIAADDVATGRLVAPVGFDSDGTSYGLIRSGGVQVAESVEILERWLTQQAG